MNGDNFTLFPAITLSGYGTFYGANELIEHNKKNQNPLYISLNTWILLSNAAIFTKSVSLFHKDISNNK